MQYLMLIILWIAWCALHSALISPAVTDRLHKRFPGSSRYHRIFYNLFAVVSLLPVLYYSFALKDAPLVAWPGPWRIVPILLGTAAIFFFLAGGRRYDALQFLGLRQIREENACGVLTEDCSLDTSGILSVVRHPWYTGGILIVWARPLNLTAIISNLIICAYLVVGAILEERKLKRLFGRQYADYQRQVSMFFPIKWVLQRFSRNS